MTLICRLIVLLALLTSSAQAQLTIRITKAAPDSLAIAIPALQNTLAGVDAAQLRQVLSQDLQRTGKLRLIDGDAQQSDPAYWRAQGARYLIAGQLQPGSQYAMQLSLSVVDLQSGQTLASPALQGGTSLLRRMGHRGADLVYEALLGERGPFDSRVAYIATEGQGSARQYRLFVADSDGENPILVLRHNRPVLSPAWSPDGEQLAYVAYEQRNQMVIYVQELRSGQRRAVASFRGINSSPSWSPDGSQLAVTLSKDGNPDVYVISANGGAARQLTRNPAIDTEPSWSPDGRSIYFTSDRSGGPQIYRVAAGGGKAERVTFTGSYNANPIVSPNGKVLVFVSQRGSRYRIAAQDLDTGLAKTLSDGPLDESPSFAPNGSMIIYASQSSGDGELAAISLDGKVRQQISLPNRGVREPAWSPRRR